MLRVRLVVVDLGLISLLMLNSFRYLRVKLEVADLMQNAKHKGIFISKVNIDEKLGDLGDNFLEVSSPPANYCHTQKFEIQPKT